MTKEELVALRRAEFPKTLRLLEMYPDEKRDLRPAEQSRTALEMAFLFLAEEMVSRDLIEGRPPTGRFPDKPATIPDTIVALREAFEGGHVAIEGCDFDRMIHFYGRMIPLGMALTIELLDHIHHRGQFTVYSRLAGARVPRIYGPSADEP